MKKKRFYLIVAIIAILIVLATSFFLIKPETILFQIFPSSNIGTAYSYTGETGNIGLETLWVNQGEGIIDNDCGGMSSGGPDYMSLTGKPPTEDWDEYSANINADLYQCKGYGRLLRKSGGQWSVVISETETSCKVYKGDPLHLGIKRVDIPASLCKAGNHLKYEGRIIVKKSFETPPAPEPEPDPEIEKTPGYVIQNNVCIFVEDGGIYESVGQCQEDIVEISLEEDEEIITDDGNGIIDTGNGITPPPPAPEEVPEFPVGLVIIIFGVIALAGATIFLLRRYRRRR